MKEIEKIIERYDSANHLTESFALGTVVRVEESSYRRIGARILVSSNGDWVGGISGGCLEGDALRRAKMAMAKDQATLITYDTRERDDHQIGVGLGCEGRIEVLFKPIKKEDLNNSIVQLKNILNKRSASILFKIISCPKKYKNQLGKSFFDNSFEQISSEINISKMELSAALVDLQKRQKSKVYNFKNSDNETAEILGEVINPKIRLVLFGDNYDVHALVEQAALLGWEIILAGKQNKIPKSINALCNQVMPFSTIENIIFDPFTALILMSHDFDKDYKALKTLANKEISYLGILGPTKRFIKIKEQLDDEGFQLSTSFKKQIYTPVGLDIGALTPEEISISIVSEILSVFRNRKGKFLKNRLGPIHEREP